MKAKSVVFILVPLLIALCHGSPVDRDEIGAPMAMRGFNNSLGLFVEFAGQASLASKDWGFCVSFNLESLDAGIKVFKAVYKDIVQTCELHVEQCPEILNITQFADRVLQDGLIDTKKQLDFWVGQLSLGEDDVANRIANSSTCIDSSINVIDVGLLEVDIIPIYEHQRPEEWLVQQKSHLYLLGNRLKSSQNAITEAIISAHQHKLSPFVLPINQLQAKISQNRRLPIERFSIRDIYLLASVVPLQWGNHVVFQVTVPLIDAEIFNIYRLTPIPRLNDDEIQLVDTESPYLGVNDHLDRYFPLQNLDDCIELGEERFVCRHNHITYTTRDDSCACSLAAIRNQSSGACTFRPVGQKSQWTPMLAPNSWMVALTKELTLTGVCSGERQELRINGSGILSIRGDCVVRSPAVNLQGETRKRIPSRKGYASLQMAAKSSPEFVTIKAFNQLLAIIGQLERNQKKVEAAGGYPMVVIAVCPVLLLIALLLAATWLYRTHRSKQLAQTQNPVNGLQDSQNGTRACNLPLLEKNTFGQTE
uniref:Iris n=1 Tax=Drosophila teissieri TaxID=7243 RepID=Q30CL2_DROTE|nr:Iris [Drosophila teissieri]